MSTKKHPTTFEFFMDAHHPEWRLDRYRQQAYKFVDIYDAFVAGTWARFDGGTLKEKFATAAIQGILANHFSVQESSEKAWNVAQAMLDVYVAQQQGPSLAKMLEEAQAQRDALSREVEKVKELEAKLENYRRCLRWYADGCHHLLEDWEAPESGAEGGWLCPPTEHLVSLEGRKVMVQFDPPWVVEDGSVARAVLDHGHLMAEDADGEVICREPKCTSTSVS